MEDVEGQRGPWHCGKRSAIEIGMDQRKKRQIICSIESVTLAQNRSVKTTSMAREQVNMCRFLTS
jgi:hypothetical protein